MKTMELLGPHAGSSSELETFSCLFCTKNIKHVNILSAELLVYIKPPSPPSPPASEGAAPEFPQV